MASHVRTTPLRERAAVAARVTLAAGGSYSIASLATALLSLTLPFSRSEAAAAALVSLALMAGIVVLVFAMRSLLRATVTLATTALALGSGL